MIIDANIEIVKLNIQIYPKVMTKLGLISRMKEYFNITDTLMYQKGPLTKKQQQKNPKIQYCDLYF